MDDIGGDAFIRSSYENIGVSRIRGSVEIESPSSQISARDIVGNTTIVSSYESVTVSDVGGWLDVRSQSAAVKVSSIKKNTSVVTSYERIEVAGIGGDLKIDGSSSSVLAEDVSGDVSIKNSYESVVLRRTSGSIKVHGNSSRIEVEQIENLPKEGRIELLTTYEPVTLILPKDADVVISVPAGGKISSDFPVYHEKSQTKSLKGALTRGSVSIRIETSGTINIKSSRMTLKNK